MRKGILAISQRLPKKISTLFLLFIAAVSIVSSFDRMGYKKGWERTVWMDGRGYYTYLPAVFIYNDPTCAFYSAKSVVQPDTANFLNLVDGKLVNKYFVGEALCQLPFFAISHLVANVFDFEPNGYSKPYQYGVAIAALFYFLISFFFIWKFLKLFEFSDSVILFVCICLAFGTNLFYYAVYEPSMVHIYSFCFITGFLYLGRSFILLPSVRKILQLGVVLGIIALIRPVDLIICTAFPLLAGNMENLKSILKWLRNHLLYLFFSFLILLLIISIQLIIYYWQTGHYFLWSYKSEGFNFAHPHVFGTLFSYEKGLFVYMPILFVGLMGLFVIAFRKPYLLLSILPVLGIIVYVVSSWHDWRYGYSFGLRAYVDFYGLVALTFAFLIDFVFHKKVLFFLIGVICFVLIGVYSVQQYQFNNNIIHPGSMNEERYWMVFLHTEKKFADSIERLPYIMESQGNFNDMEGSVDWPGTETIHKGIAHSGEFASLIDSTAPYSAVFCRKMDDEVFNSSSTIKISVWISKKQLEAAGKIVIVQVGRDSTFYSKKFAIDSKKAPMQWMNIKLDVNIPQRKMENEYLKVYLECWKGTIYVDDFSVEIIE
ncbi:hypothetical protein BH09BAC5_BH09BAC5_11560 [soil metagenome]